MQNPASRSKNRNAIVAAAAGNSPRHRTTPRTGVRSPVQHHCEHRAAHVEIRDRLPRLGVPVEIPPRGYDITPVERIADPGDPLPCQLRLPGADIEIERQEP